MSAPTRQAAQDEFVIRGGVPLRGSVTVGGNKNAAIKMIPACLLTSEPVTLHNVPNITDVHVLVDVVRALGAEVTWERPGVLRVNAPTIVTTRVPDAVARTRGGVVLAGVLLARCGEVFLPLPGGDAIGERRLDTLVAALVALGAQAVFDRGLHLRADTLRPADILLREASVTATENTLLAAALVPGTTVIRHAACEPHVQDLCHMLAAMGAHVEGLGSNQLTVHGVAALGGTSARVGADFMEVGSYIGAAVVTGGEITVHDADPQHLPMVAQTLARLGVVFEVRGPDVFVPAQQPLVVQADLGGRVPVVRAQPWPAFPPDLMSIALVIATQCTGVVMFHDWMYESRFFFSDKLVQMGARITPCDPHRVLVQGPTTLHSVPYVASPDIRAGMAMVLAALAAQGETRIGNAQHIDRGYADVEAKLRALGADITRVSIQA